MVAQLLTVDETLGKRVADGLGMKPVQNRLTCGSGARFAIVTGFAVDWQSQANA